MYCRNCGTEVGDEYKFCEKCGEKIDIEKTNVYTQQGYNSIQGYQSSQPGIVRKSSIGAYVIALPALLLLFVYKLIPVFTGLIAAFKDFNFAKGIFGSRFVGLRNFEAVISSPAFFKAVGNTLVYNIVYIIGVSAVALILALALSEIKSIKLRYFYAKVFLLPYAIPVIVLLQVIYNTFPAERSGLLMERGFLKIILIGFEIFRNCGIPAIIAAACVAARERVQGAVYEGYVIAKLMPALKGVLAFAVIQATVIFNSNIELLYPFSTGPAAQGLETIDTLAFRTGFMMGDIGASEILWLFKFVVSLALTATAYLLLRNSLGCGLFPKFDTGAEVQYLKKNNNIPGIILSSLFCIPVTVYLITVFVAPFISNASTRPLTLPPQFFRNLVVFLIIFLITAVFNAAVTAALAYPLTAKRLPISGIYTFILLAVLCSGSLVFHDYLSSRQMGMVNTVAPFFIGGLFTIMSVFALKGIFNSGFAEEKEHAINRGKGEVELFFTLFIPRIWKPLLGLTALQFISLWGSYMTSLTYSSNRLMYSPAALLATVLRGEQGYNAAVMRYGALVALIPLIVYLAFSKFLTPGVFVSQTRK